MSLPKEVTLTKANGRFYRAMTFHYVILALVIVPICFAILLALLNPFWFRDSFFNLVENRINRETCSSTASIWAQTPKFGMHSKIVLD
jgi:hypothetical protein